ncbi:MAG: bifunctional adenosylcobinamide kinase/adenosylcobinamide-phosphate guanylyltransferase [Spirochaetales bacterium]|nr:bifunctional adenosylcobinamide kinase/adenosylcobinamide-phosphate guanylyltransferase [Spirochaetales bacterium]
MAIYLITGGARSGKSTYAENLALRLCKDSSRRCYIATAEAFDDEMRSRIRAHQDRRAGKFFTVEAPVELGKAIEEVCKEKRADVILVDCLTVWTSNLLYYERLEEKESLLSALKKAACDVILVTNETGMGIVPDNALSRRFRDEAGFVNQAVASVAQNVVLMVCGLPLSVKGSL